ncbi:MAG: C45 family autoproteolytic acyltransferase/hydrolase [Candidatus Hodarchaeota archaeon]
MLNQLKLAGSYYEMGNIQGKYLKIKINLPKPSSEMVDFSNRCEAQVKQFTPDLLEELRGVADGAECDFDRLKTYFMHSPYLIGKYSNIPDKRSSPHCTVFAISKANTTDNNIIFARNYDWYPEYQDYFTVFHTYPTNKYSSIGFSDHVVGRFGGINHKGLAIAAVGVYLYNGEFTSGLLLNNIPRWILDNCKTTKEAEEFLRKAPHAEGVNYLVADKTGEIIKAETTPNKVSIINEEDGILVAANHFQSVDMKGVQRKLTNLNGHTTFPRVDGLLSFSKNSKKPISVEMVKNVLRDHQIFLCEHSSDQITAWSWVASLGTHTVFVCRGSPCKNKYTIINF